MLNNFQQCLLIFTKSNLDLKEIFSVDISHSINHSALLLAKNLHIRESTSSAQTKRLANGQPSCIEIYGKTLI